MSMGRTIRIVHVEVIRPNSAGVKAEVVRMDAVRPNPSGVMAEIIHLDAVRPNSIGVKAGMADIIRSNFMKRLFPGIFCRWLSLIHI